jgi:hypothetical protein
MIDALKRAGLDRGVELSPSTAWAGYELSYKGEHLASFHSNEGIYSSVKKFGGLLDFGFNSFTSTKGGVTVLNLQNQLRTKISGAYFGGRGKDLLDVSSFLKQDSKGVFDPKTGTYSVNNYAGGYSAPNYQADYKANYDLIQGTGYAVKDVKTGAEGYSAPSYKGLGFNYKTSESSKYLKSYVSDKYAPSYKAPYKDTYKEPYREPYKKPYSGPYKAPYYESDYYSPYYTPYKKPYYKPYEKPYEAEYYRDYNYNYLYRYNKTPTNPAGLPVRKVSSASGRASEYLNRVGGKYEASLTARVLGIRGKESAKVGGKYTGLEVRPLQGKSPRVKTEDNALSSFNKKLKRFLA